MINLRYQTYQTEKFGFQTRKQSLVNLCNKQKNFLEFHVDFVSLFVSCFNIPVSHQVFSYVETEPLLPRYQHVPQVPTCTVWSLKCLTEGSFMSFSQCLYNLPFSSTPPSCLFKFVVDHSRFQTCDKAENTNT